MTAQEDLVELERAGWRALSSSGEAAADVYGQVLADRLARQAPRRPVFALDDPD